MRRVISYINGMPFVYDFVISKLVDLYKFLQV